MVSNPYHISRQGTTVSAQIADGTDAPHTGLIKALSVYSSGSYPVRTSSDFNITAASASTINITAGRVVRDGKLMGAITAGSNIAIGTNTAGSTYSLVVVNASNAFAVKTIADVNKVPELTAGDIPIVLVLYTGASGTMEFQYFTTAKDENSLTIAYNGGGTTYTESGRITGDADSIDIVSTITNADINITPNGNGKVVLDGLNWPIADGSSNQVLKTDGSGQLSFGAVASSYTNTDAIAAVEGESSLALTGQVTAAQSLVVGGDLKAYKIYNQYQDLTGDLAVGWHSIALVEGRSGGSGAGTGGSDQRALGTFVIRNTDSSRHQTTKLTASHLFGGGQGNGISIEHSSYFSTLGITELRLKEASTYDGCVLQMYVADSTNDIEIFLTDNYQLAGWRLIDAVADASDPSTASLGVGYSTAYSSFGAANTISIATIAQLGQSIQGLLTVGSIRTSTDIEINGELNHDGSTLGLYGVNPVSRQAITAPNSLQGAFLRPQPDPTANPGFEPQLDQYMQQLEDEVTTTRTELRNLIAALEATGIIS